jgi:hypothetical protein
LPYREKRCSTRFYQLTPVKKNRYGSPPSTINKNQ